MGKKFAVKTQWLILLAGIICGVCAYWTALLNPYIIADDVRITNYWMYRYQDPTLFQNDLLTIYASNYSPWGYNFLFYVFSFVCDPVFFGHLISILMLALGGMYTFKLVKALDGEYAGILAGTCFLLSSTLISRMAGGTPRTFAYAFIPAFLYYLVKGAQWKTAVVLLLECLFYPMVFLVSFLTYALTFLKDPRKGFPVDFSRKRWICLIVTAAVCGGVLVAKYVIDYDPQIGKTYSKAELKADPESYMHGRIGPLFPQKALLPELKEGFKTGSSLFDFFPVNDFVFWPLLALVVLFLGFERRFRGLQLPVELLYLVIASVAMFIIADAVMLKLYLPRRYFHYSIPVLSIVLSSITVSRLLNRLRPPVVIKVSRVAVLVAVLIMTLPIHRGGYLLDVSAKKGLLDFIATLPKDAMIAAHPMMADDIPLFAKRKVFVNYEMSHPYYDKFWPTIRQRTLEFFIAYYNENPLLLISFLKQNHIDYLVVEEKHFKPEYLDTGRYYFQPINEVILQVILQARGFALVSIPEHLKIYHANGVFIIRTADLVAYVEGRR